MHKTAETPKILGILYGDYGLEGKANLIEISNHAGSRLGKVVVDQEMRLTFTSDQDMADFKQ